jgi:peptidoglycan hydrolase CwlO-like protein
MKNENLQKEINKLKKQVEETKEERDKFEESNKSLQDEVDSLWTMMDEMTESDIKNWTHVLDQLKTNAIAKTLMTSKNKAEA